MNKRGFTLIELLGILAILAIILLIAVSIITGIVQNSKKSALKSSAQMIIEALNIEEVKNEIFDPAAINETNIESLLGIDADNFSTVMVDASNAAYYIEIDGKNKWADLTVCGTQKNMVAVATVDKAVCTGGGGSTICSPIDLNLSDVIISEGQTYSILKVPDEDLTWSSSNETVATVDEDGVVTGVLFGTATIQAEDINENQVLSVQFTVGKDPVYLIDGSDLKTSITGGWENYYNNGDSGFVLNGGTGRYQVYSSWDNGLSTILSVNDLDITGYSKITLDVNMNTNSSARTNTTYFGIYDVNETIQTLNFTDSISYATNSTAPVNHIFELDLTGITDGEYYIKMAVHHTTTYGYTSTSSINYILME